MVAACRRIHSSALLRRRRLNQPTGVRRHDWTTNKNLLRQNVFEDNRRRREMRRQNERARIIPTSIYGTAGLRRYGRYRVV